MHFPALDTVPERKTGRPFQEARKEKKACHLCASVALPAAWETSRGKTTRASSSGPGREYLSLCINKNKTKTEPDIYKAR